MTDFKPTDEQQAAIDAFKTGGSMVLEAGAGTGKTSTLKLLAGETKNRGIYVAYNKAIADDAKSSFPGNTHCATAHSLAFRSAGLKYKHRLNGPRVTARETAYVLGINDRFDLGDGRDLHPNKIASLVMGTVKRFSYSADDDPDTIHVPFVAGTEHCFDDLADYVARLAQRAWSDIRSIDGKLRFEHDHYLKIWQLTEPDLNTDFILLDEAQDANPVIEDVVKRQDAQIIMVGDSAQQIYAWRGAEDAMNRFDADHRLVLSQSFRFGPAVAEEANKWLGILEAPLRLKGFDQINSSLGTLENPDVILCRTNAEAIAQAVVAQEEQQKKTGLVGGTTEIKRFAEAARDLQEERGTGHPELAAFKTWTQVQEYIAEESDSASDLKVFVNLIESYGVDKVIQIVDSMVDERYADLVLSTAHKAKGREWSSVKIATDFREPDEEDVDLNMAECMLAYVSVTRAMQELDNEGLKWIDRYIQRKEEADV